MIVGGQVEQFHHHLCMVERVHRVVVENNVHAREIVLDIAAEKVPHIQVHHVPDIVGVEHVVE